MLLYGNMCHKNNILNIYPIEMVTFKKIEQKKVRAVSPCQLWDKLITFLTLNQG